MEYKLILNDMCKKVFIVLGLCVTFSLISLNLVKHENCLNIISLSINDIDVLARCEASGGSGDLKYCNDSPGNKCYSGGLVATNCYSGLAR